MSIYKSVTTRNKQGDIKREIEDFYGLKVDDVLLLSPIKHIVVGIINIQKNIPFLQVLFLNNGFISLSKSFLEHSYILLDYQEKTISINKQKKALDSSLIKELESVKESFDNYGGYLNEQGEHVIDLKSAFIGPHYNVNLLLGDRSHLSEPLLTTPKGVVDEFGGGSFRGPAAVQVLATRWDMDPRENGNPFNRQFYLIENNQQIFYSHNVHENVKEAICVHKVNHSEITYRTCDDLIIKRTIYLRRQKNENEPIALERQVVEITNLRKEKRNITIVFTGMFGSANPGCQMEDVIYQSVINQSNIIYKDNKVIAISPDYYPEYAREYQRFVTLGNEGIDAYSYDLNNFIGNGSIEHPKHLLSLGNVLKEKGPSFFAISKELIINDKATITESIGLVDHHHDLYASIDTILEDKHQKELKDIIDYLKKYSSFYQVHTGRKDFDNYVNHNLPFQVLYQTFVSRAFAQTQKGYREVGFREIQDLYASMHYFHALKEDKLIKSLLGKWIENVYQMGYVNHNFFFVGKEPGMCSDDGLWLVNAIYRYLSISQDYSFLSKRFKVMGTQKTRTLYETLKAIILYSSKISVGEHSLPLLDKADWNDCLRIDTDYLSGPEKEKLYKAQLKKNKEPYGSRFLSKQSESVMNGFLLVIAIDNMMSFAKQRNDQEYLKNLKKSKELLVNSLKKNAYINGYYARVLINKESPYHYIGAPKDGLSLLDDFDGSLYLNSFSWSILSSVASEEEIKSMLPLVDKYLKTKAGYKLCTPHNLKLCGSKEAATEQYFLGDRENGGVFKHATMMFVVALLKAIKEVKDEKLKKQLKEDAEYMLEIVYPFNVLKDPYKYRGNPRFCTQYVNSLTEEHIGPILSGTSTWLLLALLEK